MRGKVLCHRVRAGRIGITPAYAGKSARGIFRFGPVRDHPRVCGEKIFCHSVVLRLLGSPPRMRGKVTLEVTYATKPGITPAYAGKSIRATAILRQSRDHPRVCGEKKLAMFEDETGQGSPPRMRGKVFYSEVWSHLYGITPAYAGKSGLAFVASFLMRDHPRVCGEKPDSSGLPPFLQGSPPRMRGKD